METEGELVAALYFKRAAEIEQLTKDLETLKRRNKKLLKANPWIGNLLGLARKAKATVVEDTASEEEKKEPSNPRQIFPKR